MWIGPPKALDWPKPMSSISTMSTFGAAAGALTWKRGGALALRASSSVASGYFGSGMGRWVRSNLSTGAFSSAAAVRSKPNLPFAAPYPRIALSAARMSGIARKRLNIIVLLVDGRSTS